MILSLIICLQILCIPNKINANKLPCESTTCKNNTTIIQSPFHLNNDQCGCPEFELYCNDNLLSTTLGLPNAGNFTVEDISYNYNEIEISDPNGCLPQKLLSLDLTITPFGIRAGSKRFWLYNCTGDGDVYIYEEIGCLSGSNYTIISADRSIKDDIIASYNCKFVKIVVVSSRIYSYYHFRRLGYYSSIYLTWYENKCGELLHSFRLIQ